MRRIVYVDWGEVDDEQGLYHAGLVVAYTLLLSNSIRRDTRVVLDLVYRGVSTRLDIRGGRVRHLRLDYSSLTGFMRRAIQGRIRGVVVTRPEPLNAHTCIWVGGGYTGVVDAWTPLPPPLRSAPTIVYARGGTPRIQCGRVVGILGKGLKPWLLLGVVQAMLDRWEYGAREARGREERGNRG